MINWLVKKLLKNNKFREGVFKEVEARIVSVIEENNYANQWHRPYVKARKAYIKGLDDRINELTEQFKKQLFSEFDEYTKGEKFMDSMVSKINRKQLK